MSDDPGTNLLLGLIVWAVAAAAICYLRGWGQGVGLVPAYVFNLWLLHWPAATLYLLPWYWGVEPELVEAGLRMSAYAIVAFAIGSVVLGPAVGRAFGIPRASGSARVPQRLLPRMYVLIGLGCYAALGMLGPIPTVTALVVTGWSLVVVGIGLSVWTAWQDGRPSFLVGWLALAALLPLFTVVTDGFLGYGVGQLVAVVTLVVATTRPRLAWLLVVPAVFYIGLSFYVTYMRDRGEIRDVVWTGAPAESRLEQLATTLADFEWFDPYDNRQLARIDMRLNQDWLVGAAVRHLEERQHPFANGETLWDALIALVPRALWPDKPAKAGSAGLVSTYTGIQVAPGTSVGIGPVMEFYINFGRTGVWLGFLMIGTIVWIVDRGARLCLARGDWQAFAQWYLPGLMLLAVGGSLMEVTSGAGAAMVTAFLVNRFLLPGLQGHARIADVGAQQRVTT